MVNWPDRKGLLRTTVPGPTGEIECLIETPAALPKGLCLICHPHPQFGGTMDNKVVYSLARSALNSGWTAVRFNYRGVGRSTGSYDEGRGELEDAVSMLSLALQHQPGPVMLAGFSFGAAIALRLSARVNAQALVTIAPPLRYFSDETLPHPDCPWLVVHGDKDDVVDCDETLAVLAGLPDKPDIHVLQEAGHFFHGRLTELREIVESFIHKWQNAAKNA